MALVKPQNQGRGGGQRDTTKVLPKCLENVWSKSHKKIKGQWGTFPSSHQGSMTPTLVPQLGWQCARLLQQSSHLTSSPLPLQSLCLTVFYRQAQSVIHSLATRLSSLGPLRHTCNSQVESLTARWYSVVLSYGLVISYMYAHPSRDVSSIESPIGGYWLLVNFTHFSYNHSLLTSLCRIHWWIISFWCQLSDQWWI